MNTTYAQGFVELDENGVGTIVHHLDVSEPCSVQVAAHMDSHGSVAFSGKLHQPVWTVQYRPLDLRTGEFVAVKPGTRIGWCATLSRPRAVSP